jgi:hypothetical protein
VSNGSSPGWPLPGAASLVVISLPSGDVSRATCSNQARPPYTTIDEANAAAGEIHGEGGVGWFRCPLWLIRTCQCPLSGRQHSGGASMPFGARTACGTAAVKQWRSIGAQGSVDERPKLVVRLPRGLPPQPRDYLDQAVPAIPEPEALQESPSRGKLKVIADFGDGTYVLDKQPAPQLCAERCRQMLVEGGGSWHVATSLLAPYLADALENAAGLRKKLRADDGRMTGIEPARPAWKAPGAGSLTGVDAGRQRARSPLSGRELRYFTVCSGTQRARRRSACVRRVAYLGPGIRRGWQTSAKFWI